MYKLQAMLSVNAPDKKFNLIALNEYKKELPFLWRIMPGKIS
jgi:hypothetical protein